MSGSAHLAQRKNPKRSLYAHLALRENPKRSLYGHLALLKKRPVKRVSKASPPIRPPPLPPS